MDDTDEMVALRAGSRSSRGGRIMELVPQADGGGIHRVKRPALLVLGMPPDSGYNGATVGHIPLERSFCDVHHIRTAPSQKAPPAWAVDDCSTREPLEIPATSVSVDSAWLGAFTPSREHLREAERHTKKRRKDPHHRQR